MQKCTFCLGSLTSFAFSLVHIFCVPCLPKNRLISLLIINYHFTYPFVCHLAAKFSHFSLLRSRWAQTTGRRLKVHWWPSSFTLNKWIFSFQRSREKKDDECALLLLWPDLHFDGRLCWSALGKVPFISSISLWTLVSHLICIFCGVITVSCWPVFWATLSLRKMLLLNFCQLSTVHLLQYCTVLDYPWFIIALSLVIADFPPNQHIATF